jgi:adenylate cyclase class 2
MYEVEVKVPADHAAVRSRLEDRGAERLGAVSQTDTYYDAPDRDFASTDEALRIRREDPADGSPGARLTYKGPLVDPESKTREEAETTLTDADEMAAILVGLGYEAAAVVEKDRERYAYDGFVVTLDDVAGVGRFVEVETQTESAVDAAREAAFEILRDLDLDPADQVRTSYLGLRLENASE